MTIPTFTLPPFNPMEGVPKLEPVNNPFPATPATPEPEMVGAKSGLEADPVKLNFEFKMPESDFSRHTTEPSIYTDLDPVHLLVKDKVAKSIQQEKNVKHWFNTENISKTTDELYKAEQDTRDENNFNRILDSLFGNGFDPGEMNDDLFNSGQEEINRMVADMPVRPARPEIEKPSQLSLALAGIAGLAGAPGQTFRTLAIPFQYMMQKNANDIALQDQEYNDKVKLWQLKFGLTRERAQAMAEREKVEYTTKAQNLTKRMENMFELHKQSLGFAQEDKKMWFDANQALAKYDASQQEVIVKQAFDLMQNGNSPVLRQAGAALVGAYTGLEMDISQVYTPGELKQLAEAQGINLKNLFDKDTYGARVLKTNSEAQTAAVDAAYADQKAQAELSSIFSLTNSRNVQSLVSQHRLNLDYAKFNADQINGGSTGGASKWEIGKQIDGIAGDYTKAYNALKTQQSGLSNAMAKRKEEVLKDFKPLAPGWFGDKSKVAQENDRRKGELLANDEQYRSLGKQMVDVNEEMSTIQTKQGQLSALSIGKMDSRRVQSFGEKLGKAKTESAYREILAAELQKGAISPLEAVKAMFTVKPADGGDISELRQSLLLEFANRVLQAPGLAEAYTKQTLSQFEQQLGGGGPSLTGPFQEPQP